MLKPTGYPWKARMRCIMQPQICTRNPVFHPCQKFSLVSEIAEVESFKIKCVVPLLKTVGFPTYALWQCHVFQQFAPIPPKSLFYEEEWCQFLWNIFNFFVAAELRDFSSAHVFVFFCSFQESLKMYYVLSSCNWHELSQDHQNSYTNLYLSLFSPIWRNNEDQKQFRQNHVLR